MCANYLSRNQSRNHCNHVISASLAASHNMFIDSSITFVIIYMMCFYYGRYMSYARPVDTPASTPMMSQSFTSSSLHYASSGYYESETLKSVGTIVEKREQPDGSAETTLIETNKLIKDEYRNSINFDMKAVMVTEKRDGDENDDAAECEEMVTSQEEDDVKYMEDLDKSLYMYYVEYVSLEDGKKDEIMDIANYVNEILVEAFKAAMPKHEIIKCNIEDVLFAQLHAVHMNTVRVMLKFKSLDSDLWQLHEGSDSIYGAAGYCLIKRYNQSFFGLGSSPYDQHLIGDYLSGRKLRCVFLEMCHRGLNWGNAYRVLPAVTGDTVTLQIYKEDALLIAVEFVPSLSINGLNVLSLPHPGAMEDAGLENLWLKDEFDYPPYLKSNNTGVMNNNENDNMKVCMRVLRSVALNHTETSIFTEDMIMSAVMSCMSDLKEGSISEQTISTAVLFTQSCQYLGKCLEEEKLMSYTSREHNLLADHAGPMMQFTSTFMKLVINRKLYTELLINRNV